MTSYAKSYASPIYQCKALRQLIVTNTETHANTLQKNLIGSCIILIAEVELKKLIDLISKVYIILRVITLSI